MVTESHRAAHGHALEDEVLPGPLRSQAEESFRRDAVEAIAHGWQPTAQQWNGSELVVTYTYGPSAPVAPPSVPAAIAEAVPVRHDSRWPMVGAIVALVALGAITGLAVSGLGPFGSDPRSAPADVRPYVPSANVGNDDQADAGTGTSCHDWGTRLDDQHRLAMSAELLGLFRREQGTGPTTTPDEEVLLMMGILDAMCAEPGNAGASVGAMAGSRVDERGARGLTPDQAGTRR